MVTEVKYSFVDRFTDALVSNHVQLDRSLITNDVASLLKLIRCQDMRTRNKLLLVLVNELRNEGNGFPGSIEDQNKLLETVNNCLYLLPSFEKAKLMVDLQIDRMYWDLITTISNTSNTYAGSQFKALTDECYKSYLLQHSMIFRQDIPRVLNESEKNRSYKTLIYSMELLIIVLDEPDIFVNSNYFPIYQKVAKPIAKFLKKKGSGESSNLMTMSGLAFFRVSLKNSNSETAKYIVQKLKIWPIIENILTNKTSLFIITHLCVKIVISLVSLFPGNKEYETRLDKIDTELKKKLCTPCQYTSDLVQYVYYVDCLYNIAKSSKTFKKLPNFSVFYNNVCAVLDEPTVLIDLLNKRSNMDKPIVSSFIKFLFFLMRSNQEFGNLAEYSVGIMSKILQVLELSNLELNQILYSSFKIFLNDSVFYKSLFKGSIFTPALIQGTENILEFMKQKESLEFENNHNGSVTTDLFFSQCNVIEMFIKIYNEDQAEEFDKTPIYDLISFLKNKNVVCQCLNLSQNVNINAEKIEIFKLLLKLTSINIKADSGIFEGLVYFYNSTNSIEEIDFYDNFLKLTMNCLNAENGLLAVTDAPGFWEFLCSENNRVTRNIALTVFFKVIQSDDHKKELCERLCALNVLDTYIVPALTNKLTDTGDLEVYLRLIDVLIFYCESEMVHTKIFDILIQLTLQQRTLAGFDVYLGILISHKKDQVFLSHFTQLVNANKMLKHVVKTANKVSAISLKTEIKFISGFIKFIKRLMTFKKFRNEFIQKSGSPLVDLLEAILEIRNAIDDDFGCIKTIPSLIGRLLEKADRIDLNKQHQKCFVLLKDLLKSNDKYSPNDRKIIINDTFFLFTNFMLYPSLSHHVVGDDYLKVYASVILVEKLPRRTILVFWKLVNNILYQLPDHEVGKKLIHRVFKLANSEVLISGYFKQPYDLDVIYFFIKSIKLLLEADFNYGSRFFKANHIDKYLLDNYSIISADINCHGVLKELKKMDVV